jgi:hypothetical protein
VDHHTRSITASKGISQFTQSGPPSASRNSLNHGLLVDTLHGLQTHSITASHCISQFTRSWALSASPNWLYHGLQVHLSVHSISGSKCISNLAQSRPASASLSSPDRRLSVHVQTSHNLLDLGHHVHISLDMITASQWNSKFSQWASPGAPLIAFENPSAARLAVCIYIERLT